MANTYNKISLKTMGHEETVKLGAAASPGMAMEYQDDGKWDPAVSSSAIMAKRGISVLKESSLQGKTVEDALTENENVQVIHLMPGDHAQLLVKDGQTLAKGAYISIEGGASGLFIATASLAKAHAQCIDAISPSGANGLVRARIL